MAVRGFFVPASPTQIQPMSDLVREYLDHYLHPETQPRFAVMLKGEWGAGKTYFIRDYLKTFAAKRKAFDPLYHSGYYYVSLFGKTTRADIAAALFNAAHPALGSGAAALIANVASRAANTVTKGQAIREGDAAALQVAMTNLDGRALIFDDLERCPMKLEELFGYLNDFVEAKRLKVILLADETRLLKKHEADYPSQKEKVVGKTLVVRSEPGPVVDAILAEIGHDETRGLIQRNRDLILSLFKASETNNFRSLQGALLDLEHLLKRAPRLAGKDLPARKVLAILVALTLEVRAGRLRPSDFQTVIGLRSAMLRSFKKTLTPEQETAEQVQNRYTDVAWDDPVVPVQTLVELVDEGVIDCEALETAVAEHPLIAGKTEAPPWRTLVWWRNLTQTEYAEARQRVLEMLVSGAVVHPGQILHLLGVAISLARAGDPLVEGNSVRYFRSYIKARLDDGTLISEPGMSLTRHDLGDTWGGIMYDNAADRAFARVRRGLAAALKAALNRTTAHEAPRVLKAFQDGNYAFLSPHDEETDGFRQSPLLHQLPIDAVADLIITDGRLNELLVNSLIARHFKGHGGTFKEEVRWMGRLKAELLTRASSLPPPFRDNVSGKVRYWFEHVV